MCICTLDMCINECISVYWCDEYLISVCINYTYIAVYVFNFYTYMHYP